MAWPIADCLSSFYLYAYCLLWFTVSFDQVPTWPIAPIGEFNGNKEESQSELTVSFIFVKIFSFLKLRCLEPMVEFFKR